MKRSTIFGFSFAKEKPKWVQSTVYNIEELRYRIQSLEYYCGAHMDPAIRAVYLKPRRALKILKDLLYNSNRESLQGVLEVNSLIKCILILFQSFISYSRIRKSFWSQIFALNPYETVKSCYTVLVFSLLPEKMDTCIDVTLDFLKNEDLWNVEFLCFEIIIVMLSCHIPVSEIVNRMIDYLKEVIVNKNDREARNVLAVLKDILVPIFWSKVGYKELLPLITIYHDSVFVKDGLLYELHFGIRNILFNICNLIDISELKKIIDVLILYQFETELEGSGLLEFNSLIIRAVSICATSDFTDILKANTLDLLIHYINCSDATKSFLANEVLSCIIDRNKNIGLFPSPRIFQIDVAYNITIGKYTENEKNLIKEYRYKLMEAILHSITHFHHSRLNIETTYRILSILMTQIPTGFISAFVATILYEIQNFVVISPSLDFSSFHRLHSTVASVFTLLCWIYRPKTFTHYVNSIISQRSITAPHLNPPFQNHPDTMSLPLSVDNNLLFDLWDLRHGLWKLHRCAEATLPKPTAQMDRNELGLTRSVEETGLNYAHSDKNEKKQFWRHDEMTNSALTLCYGI